MNFRIIISFILIFSTYTGSYSQTKNSNEKMPKLVVGIVIDQMRYEYINRFWNKYGDDGFKKLINSGFNCKNTHYNYIPTYTGPGHASIYTGTTPSMHGIIGNNWYDRDLSKLIYCTENIDNPIEKDNMGPGNMLTTTITDELRIFSNFRAKVIGISLKDRGAILPAGHSATAAYWIDKKSANWITSPYYMKDIPEWVNNFNLKKTAQKYLSQNWSTILPIEDYYESASDKNKYEKAYTEKGDVIFPYNLNEISKEIGLGLIASTPFGNDLTKDFAIEAIKQENLGKNGQTDFITISFSSPDYIGHQFGPQSIEIEDTYLRLDKTLAELISFIESQLGKQESLFFITADHGCANNPAFMNDHKIKGGYFDSKKMINSINKILNDDYGSNQLILNYSNEQIFLNKKLIAEMKINLGEVQEKISEICLKSKGVANAISARWIEANSYTEKPISLIQKGYNKKRSGDIILILEPGWMDYNETGTTHGAMYTYDTHVPLLWYGWKIKQGYTAEAINITDIAPTISTLIGIPFPNGCIGKSIEEIISQ